MKKNILSIAVIATALLAASCQKENNQGGVTPGQDAPQFTASTEGCDNTKTTVEKSGTTYKTKWESGEEIRINGAIYSATPDGTDARKATFTYKSGDTPTGTYKAYFPASMYDGTTATLPATYTYTEGKYNMPMYAESTSENLSFKNLCGVLAITVPSTEMAKVTSIIVTSDQRMNGAFTATEAGVLTFTSSAALTGADKKVTLTFGEAKDITTSATFYIPVPAGTHNLAIYALNGTTTTKTMVTKKSGGVTIARNKVYPITFAANHSFVLSGEFTVSSDNKKVRFSQGNLYYDGTDFNFEANQYDYCNSYNASHLSHFCWSPNISDAISTSYDSSNPLSGGTSDWFFTNASGFTVQFQTEIWSTLSNEEWEYLLSTRTKTCAMANINNGIKGLVIFPDGYEGATSGDGLNYLYSSLSGKKSGTGVDFPDTYITLENWATMESRGCVFLPAAGHREKTKMNNVNERVEYWSRSTYANDSAYNVRIEKDRFTPKASGQSRYRGYSVRLVCNVKVE